MSADVDCPECGARGRFGACAELFDELLALDHERREPWGRFHGLNVACYLLQHPSSPFATAEAGQWELVITFLDGGLDAADALTAWRVRANRHGRRPWATLEATPPRSAPVSYTIEDVSVDGTFPAGHYAQRMRSWARSVASERGHDG